MRSTNEQLNEIMSRAEKIKEKKVVKKRFYAYAVAVCCCVVLLVAVTVFLPQLTADTQDIIMPQYGSMVLSTSVMGYVVVGFLAMMLGICGTLLCVSWKKLKEQ